MNIYHGRQPSVKLTLMTFKIGSFYKGPEFRLKRPSVKFTSVSRKRFSGDSVLTKSKTFVI